MRASSKARSRVTAEPICRALRRILPLESGGFVGCQIAAQIVAYPADLGQREALAR